MYQANDSYLFLDTDEYTIGTPIAIPKSDRTLDIRFHRFAENTYLLEKLNLVQTKSVIHDLAAFRDSDREMQRRRDYLQDNGLVRILIKEDHLLDQLIPPPQQLSFYWK